MSLQIADLPDAFLLLLLSNWLTLIDVTNFDSSFCCNQRNWLLELLNGFKQSIDFDDFTKAQLYDIKFYRWIFLRGIQLKALEFSQKSFMEKTNKKKGTFKYVRVKMENVESLHFNTLISKKDHVHAHPLVKDFGEICRIINSCPNLRVLKVTLSRKLFIDWNLSDVDGTIVSQLTELMIIDSYNADYTSIISHIVEYCRNLKRFILKSK